MTNKKIFFQKKAEVGKTVTLIFSLFIILFILLIYFVVVGILAAERYAPIIGKGGNEISISKTTDNFEVQKKLFYLLNSPLENGETIKELIILSEVNKNEDAETKLKENAEKILNKDGECYLFLVNGEKVYNKLSYGEITGGMPFLQENALAEIILFSNQQQINTRLYSKKPC